MSDYSSTGSSDSWSSSESGSDDEETIQLLRKISKMDVNENKPNRFLGTGIVYHQIMTEHKCDWDTSYPEHPGRLTESYDRCRELGLVDRCLQIELHYAMEDQIMEVHSQDLLTTAQSTAMMSVEELKELAEKHDSWYSNNSTYEAALAAAGSAINLVDHVLDEKIDNGFALVRPPGHHAMHSEFNGYCTFNNVAIAAERALSRGVSRILIVDWDVHHGQGVQRHFYKDSRVLYFSIHRYEYGRFWPELRESDYDFIGKDNGLGYNINIPLNKNGMTNSDYMAVLHQVLLPVAYEFQPQLILISNGLDSAIGDEKGEMLLTPSMYAHMVHHLMGLATGRVCAVLEGGYCVKSLAEGCAHTLRSLLQDPCPMLKALEEPSDSVISTILNVVKVLRPYWNCFAYHQLLLPNESCQFPEVSSVPPLPGVEFSTPENRPEKFEILHNYPTQSAETIQHYSALIDDLIKETDLSVAADRCCYVFDPDMRAHKNLDLGSHPERPDRISRIYAKLAEQGLLKRCLEVESRLARKEELLLIHSESHITAMQETQRMSEKELSRLPLERLYISIYLHQRTMHCALLSCGSLLNVVEAVMTKQAQSGVAIIRPPGHHAESHCAMGFCIFNNVGIAAKFAQKHFNVKRVLIVDWDVHHGNATQHQFYDDPSVLYISLHRYDKGGFFPGSDDADADHTGTGAGQGFNVNIPWNFDRMGDPEYLAAFTQIVMPIAYQFAPELVLVSAGFDAAEGDPLGGYKLTPVAY
ncbi:histone deacetylase 6, partial [Aplysia californica]|uniref:Histone deacetylase 6 n=1 Tax=Aplysia californica TaxID=6500 RepID=A0ABM1W2F9_APLCA